LRVIAKKILREYWVKHPDSEQQLKSWYQEAEDADWKSGGIQYKGKSL
jgi:mRNA interferase HigB